MPLVAGVALGAPRQRQSEGQRAEQQARLRDLPHQVLFTSPGTFHIHQVVLTFATYITSPLVALVTPLVIVE